MEDERMNPFEIEETVEDKIFGLEAMNEQMRRMIDENHRMIGLGDDVVGRENMIKHLTREIQNNAVKIEALKNQQEK